MDHAPLPSQVSVCLLVKVHYEPKMMVKVWLYAFMAQGPVDVAVPVRHVQLDEALWAPPGGTYPA
jgi:hypothetical protein